MRDDIRDAWIEWKLKCKMFKMATGCSLVFLIVALAICAGGGPAHGYNGCRRRQGRHGSRAPVLG